MVDATGLPIAGSSLVSDAALDEARRIANLMLSHRPDIRDSMIAREVKIAVMATTEVTTDIPEHAFLKSDPNTDWDQRARGLGGTLWVPTTSGAEENILCLDGDRYQGESILIHEFAHTILNLGMPFVTDGPALIAQLTSAFDQAQADGRWAETYAATNVHEYWAEGVQGWFGANTFADPPDGIHNHVANRAALESYDPALADVIHEVFAAETYACP